MSRAGRIAAGLIAIATGIAAPATAETRVHLGGGPGWVSDRPLLHGAFPGLTGEVAWGSAIATVPLRFDYNVLPHGEGGQFDGTFGLRFCSPTPPVRVYVDIGGGASTARNADLQGLCGTWGGGVVLGRGKPAVWVEVRRLDVVNWESDGASGVVLRAGLELR
ncbi:MAG TPA: hypothetical protein VFK69_14360 [Candidatus Eisenbacteria bacterium]|nr:hypothetical protein [Candidatus Eisenbacteria bacterium]